MKDRLRRINNVQRDLLNLIHAVKDNLDLNGEDTAEDFEFLDTLFKEQSDLTRIQVKRARDKYFTDTDI